MPVFPIFRLPYLAAKAVVNRIYYIGDLTALFLCSKKTRKFIKSLRKSVSFVALSIDQKKNLNCLEMYELFREEKLTGKFPEEYVVEVDIKISDDIGFQLTAEFESEKGGLDYLTFHVYAECIKRRDQYKGTRRILRIGGINIPVVMTKKDVIYTFWGRKQYGFEMIGEYFRQSIFGLIIDVGRKQEFSENLRFVINWMNSTNRIPKCCSIYDTIDKKFNEEDVKFILNTVHPTEEYEIWVELKDEFHHNTNFKVEDLYLTYSNWFTIENLLTADCERINLGKSKLTNEDLKEYLKQLLAGNFSKLRKLNVEMTQEDMNIDIILSGFEVSSEYEIIRKNKSVRIRRNEEFVDVATPGKTSKTFEMKTSRDYDRS